MIGKCRAIAMALGLLALAASGACRATAAPGGQGATTAKVATERNMAILPPEFPVKMRMQAILYDADAALKRRDFGKAHARFAQARAMFREHAAELTTSGGFIGQAEISYSLALATGRGKLGDPCPEFGEARELAEQARNRGKASDGVKVAAVIRSFLAENGSQAALYGCPGSSGTDLRQSLAGHYYLSGIHEVGSELLLRPDARFEWMLAYGSMDQSASGTWRVEGSAVILTADQRQADRPLAALGPFLEWDIDAENAFRRQALERAQTAVAMKCPFLAGADAMVTTAVAYLDEAEREAAKIAARKSLPAAIQRERASRDQLETAAAAAMSATADRAATMAKANAALEAWQTAQGDLADVYSRAGLAGPVRTAPRLPAACTMPQLVEADRNDVGRWTPSIGVRLRFADEELSAVPMAVTFRFADGTATTVVSDRDGYAFVPTASASGWTGTLLAIPTTDGVRPVPLAAPHRPRGIQTIMLDDKALTPAPFETMRLTVDGQCLVPEGRLARGSYSRAP